MLNLLISIISDTYARVASRAKQLMYGEFAQLIVEHRHLVTEEEMQAQERKGRYMYIAWVDDTQQMYAANAEQNSENRGLKQIAEIQRMVALMAKGQEEDRVRMHDQLCEIKKQVAEMRAALDAKEWLIITGVCYIQNERETRRWRCASYSEDVSNQEHFES